MSDPPPHSAPSGSNAPPPEPIHQAQLDAAAPAPSSATAPTVAAASAKTPNLVRQLGQLDVDDLSAGPPSTAIGAPLPAQASPDRDGGGPPSSKRRRSSATPSLDPVASTSRSSPSAASRAVRDAPPASAGTLAGSVPERHPQQWQEQNGGTGGAEQRHLSPVPAATTATRGKSPSPALSALSLPSFPVLPPSAPTADQTFQTPSQVSSILSLPPPLLLQLARTGTLQEQSAIAEAKGVKGYLSSMAIPPPSPTTLVNTIAREGLAATTLGGASAASVASGPAGASTSSSTTATASATASTSASSTLPTFSLPLSLPLSSSSAYDDSDGQGHPSIPVLLGQVFAPPPLTPGLLAPIPGIPNLGDVLLRLSSTPSTDPTSSTSAAFEPVFASVEQWSVHAAQEHVSSAPSASRPGLPTSRSFNDREVAHLAQQLKGWALSEQSKQVDQRVVEAKSAAVVLAAQAQAATTAAGEAGTAASTSAGAGGAAGAGAGMGASTSVAEAAELGAYADLYKKQLDALASGYFAQLHRDALKRLTDEKTDSTTPSTPTRPWLPSSSAAGGVPAAAAGAALGSPGLSSSRAPTLTSLTSLTGARSQAEAMHVRASAAAAVAAQVLAAKELARHAGEKLVGMGVDPRRVVEEVEGLVEEQKGSRRGSVVAAEKLGVSLAAATASAAAVGLVGPTTSAAAGAPGMRRSSTTGTSASMGGSEPMAVEDVGRVPTPSTAAGPHSSIPADFHHQQQRPALPSVPSASLAELSSLPPAQQPHAAHAAHAAAHAQQASGVPVPPPSQAQAPEHPHGAVPATVHDLPDLAALATPEKRDYLLSFAHQTYSTEPQSPNLLPLLHTLEAVHPDHLPTLLLISCVYYTRGELESSLYYNKRLLEFDPSYVEAMSNIGTTLRAMGKWQEAEAWWWKAIKLRPTYWDATENLLGVLCNPSSTVQSAAPGQAAPPTAARYKEALALCDYVESQIFAQPASAANPAIPPTQEAFLRPLAHIPRPRTLPAAIPFNHVHRLQNLLYAKGNLRLALADAPGAQDEYEKAIEIALSLPEWARRHVSTGLHWPVAGCTVRDLVVAAVVIGRILAAFAESATLVPQVARELGVADEQGGVPFERLVRTVRDGGDAYVRRLLHMGGGVLPTVLLEPTFLNQLPGMLFSETRSTLPAMFDPAVASNHVAADDPSRKGIVQSTNQTTSTMLLTLAKILQDSLAPTAGAVKLTLGGVPASQSLLLPLYYVALALYPSPSTCNNLGILLSTLNATTVIGSQDPTRPQTVLTGQQLALRYYETGLKLDPRHPHLYTNLGSLLKDLGQLPQAVGMYRRAVECNPSFDVALANLANAVKDTGDVEGSIPYYRRAVELNPKFPEAVCGLVNALGGVCNWQGRGGVGEEWLVDGEGRLRFAAKTPDGATVRDGYMRDISDLVRKQLVEGSAYGVGALRSYGGINELLTLVSRALWGVSPAEAGEAAMKPWVARFQFLLGDYDRSAHNINEGGYLVRLVERLMRRIQRRWYLDTYGRTPYLPVDSSPPPRIAPSQADVDKYRRPPLPPSLPPMPVPTVLPFHCFTLPVTARETRLISHRTGLRISHATLNQPWMPPIVYPPPRPPVAGKINIGYVSSDLGNHPLSHLMQSVFGYHDLSRFNVYVYATSPSDKSPYRLKIEAESQHFVDVSRLPTEQIVRRIVQDEIHVLVNLSGYTKGARNEVFAARPAPVQASYMGFASTLAAGWCDYFIVDPIVCPPRLISGNQWRWVAGFNDSEAPDTSYVAPPTEFEGDPDPESDNESFVYTEKLLYLPHSYFVTDHKQAWREDESAGVVPGEAPFRSSLPAGSPEAAWAVEEHKRWRMRKQMFPLIRDDTIIFANWNQLYKIDPFIFRIWLSILSRHPNSILWLLRFPAPGEAHLKETAVRWAGQEVADRVVFTDVANKNEHVMRGRIADLFLDTTECNAHTTAADILWSGTPILTFPRHEHKMCSRVAASIAVATGLGSQMIVDSAEAYEQRALSLAAGLSYEMVPAHVGAAAGTIEGGEQRRARGELADMRRRLFLEREQSPLFDTRRWTRNLEKGIVEAWERYVSGAELEDDPHWASSVGRTLANIWVADDVDSHNVEARTPYFQ
ncbi:glycosyltransferase family 41 protein [Rhodotorula graminis WP1]|uniref:protein O-GlcNAc transferase n=1 Tax=Rhodotorula graminis (strain WP1) TaxID=578459 RepID=A0A194SDJ1_RHOGW|nr:glycosyltransferase family 41 protein [Rhodotorula graminis WP1]KPV78662.1 glycosyltransferase family 41 protein [Rhodotorula graminis WP1]